MKKSLSNPISIKDSSIKTTLLLVLQKKINFALSLDPVIALKLSKMADIVIVVKCREPVFQCYISLRKEGVQLLSHYDGKTDAGVCGSLIDLARFLTVKNASITEVTGLIFWGNQNILNSLRAIQQSIEIDWETLLCLYFGDIGGHLVAKGLNFSSRKVHKVKTVAKYNLVDYLQEELRLVPSNSALNAFASDVAILKTAVDAFADNVNKLANKG